VFGAEAAMSEIVLARAGEEILCPECREALGVVTEDYGELGPWPVSFTPLAEVRARGQGRDVKCKRCGVGPCQGTGGVDIWSADPAVMMFMRSGSWVGWRGLGE